LIIGPCTIVTGGAKPAVLAEAGVRVTGAHIAQLGPVGNLAAAYPEETVWPARGRVLMPGFVNTHAHLARHLARGLKLAAASDWRRYEQALSPEDVRWATTAALVEGVRHGITTVGDFHRSGACIDLSLSEVLDAARAVGVRVATCYGASETDSPAERRAGSEECAGFAADIARQREGGLRGLIGIQATTLAGVESLLHEALEIAGDRLAVHVDLALDSTPAERWKAKRRWRESALPSLWAHAESAPKGLLQEAQERGDVLSAIMPASVTALAREIEIAWGSDSGVNAPPLPENTAGWATGGRAEMHYQRLFVNGPRWAARLFGLGLGEIAAGSPADLVLLDYRPATEFSSRTLFEHLWSGLLRAPVSGVMVAGEVLLDNGVIVSADEREVAERARECARRVWERLE
jgi:cytosine/adenosine deaminase-related metal-dependent hydrolase